MSKRVYVTYTAEEGCKRKKLVKFNEGDLRDFSSIATKIKAKFSLPSDRRYNFEGMFESHGPYVEIDDTDEDILGDIVELKVSGGIDKPQAINLGLQSGASSYNLERSTSDSSVPYSQASTREYGQDSQSSPRSTASSSSIVVSDVPEDSPEVYSQDEHQPSSQHAFWSRCSKSRSTHLDSELSPSTSCPLKSAKVVFDAKKSLAGHPKGQAILEEYHKNGFICPSSRMGLVSILVAELVEKCGNYPAIQYKHALGRAIISAFPNLRDPKGQSGYDHFFSSAGGQCGYIQDKLKNIRRRLPQSAKQKIPRRSASTSPSTCSTTGIPEPLPQTEADELVSFCKNAVGDRNRQAVVRAMEKCASNRRIWIETEKPFLSEVLRKYPRFLDIPELIDQDYQSMHGATSSCLLRRWASHARSLLTYSSNCKQEGVCKVMRDYNAINSKEPNDELTALYGFLVLLRLLPSHNTKKKGRASSQDVEDLLVKFYEVGTTTSEALKDRSTTQPTLLAFGSKQSIEQIILKIEDYGFHLSSSRIVLAVDTLFKSHFVFNLEYSVQLSNFFIYLQTEIYGLKYNGKVPSRVTEIATATKAK